LKGFRQDTAWFTWAHNGSTCFRHGARSYSMQRFWLAGGVHCELLVAHSKDRFFHS
jgi:hypothetical protein